MKPLFRQLMPSTRDHGDGGKRKTGIGIGIPGLGRVFDRSGSGLAAAAWRLGPILRAGESFLHRRLVGGRWSPEHMAHLLLQNHLFRFPAAHAPDSRRDPLITAEKG